MVCWYFLKLLGGGAKYRTNIEKGQKKKEKYRRVDVFWYFCKFVSLYSWFSSAFLYLRLKVMLPNVCILVPVICSSFFMCFFLECAALFASTSCSPASSLFSSFYSLLFYFLLLSQLRFIFHFTLFLCYFPFQPFFLLLLFLCLSVPIFSLPIFPSHFIFCQLSIYLEI